jgi:hypothetical protein
MKRPLADVLWEAANVYLSATDNPQLTETLFSCIATAKAEGTYPFARGHAYCWLEEQMDELRNRGASRARFHEFNEGEERQGVRYMWLLLAMHVAEDEGIEIEVAEQ